MWSSTKGNYQVGEKDVQVIDFDDNVMGIYNKNINGKYIGVIRTLNTASRKRVKPFFEFEAAYAGEAARTIHDFWFPEKPYGDRFKSSVYSLLGDL